jgi:aspartate/methionine/tyrosine aminotransferase
MPRHPKVTSLLSGVERSVFSSLAHRLHSHEGEVFPLHVGDTWLEPAEGCRMEDLRVDEYPGMHRYAPPQGIPELLDAIVDRTRARTGTSTERAGVLVSAGATGALSAVMGAILEPGDEVLVLAPYWPLINGIIRRSVGSPVIVPFLGMADSPETAVEVASQYHSSRTVALYVSTPNNPTGKLIPASWVDALVDWATAKNLWIVSDEVYEDYVYAGEHRYCRPLAPERTFSVHSFSKAFGMAGNRCGYVVGPAEIMGELRKINTHTFYSTSTASQLAACRALDGRGDSWVSEVRKQYVEMGRRAAARLGFEPPEGSTFLFFDVAEHLDDRGLMGFLERCVDRGLFVAPGTSFGPYPSRVRLCYTAMPPDAMDRGIEVMASILGK